MALPWVVVTDPFESQDLLLRRTKEFDRSGFFGDLIGGILPEQHIQFLSTDDRFRRNRNLINHLMAPTFISRVSAPEVYRAAGTLVRLWQLRCDLARGRPFAAHGDITFLALDSIFASSFGLPEAESNTTQRLEALQRWQPQQPGDLLEEDDNDRVDSPDTPVRFPDDAPVPEVFSAVLTLANSVTDTQLSPAPRLTSWLLRKLPYMRRATAIKDAYLARHTEACIALVEEKQQPHSLDEQPHSALHSVLLRERDVAAKEGRPPAYRRRGIADEFFGFMTAGHDTSATTLAWGVKLLADHPTAQTRLRAALRAALPAAARGRRAFSYAEFAAHGGRGLPYLDAVVEEVARHANTIAFVVRRAQVDGATVLGRRVPRGTDVFLMANGAGYLEPNMRVADEERSPGARRGTAAAATTVEGEEEGEGREEGKMSNKKKKNNALTGAWDDEDIALFRPERWLREGPGGEEVFDSMAGPTLAFGAGPRGCFGKRLALQTLKLQFALIVWHFELLKCPEELSGYNSVQRFAREPTQCYVRLAEAAF